MNRREAILCKQHGIMFKLCMHKSQCPSVFCRSIEQHYIVRVLTTVRLRFACFQACTHLNWVYIKDSQPSATVFSVRRL